MEGRLARVIVRIPERARATTVREKVAAAHGDAVNGWRTGRDGARDFAFDPAGIAPVSDFDALARVSLLHFQAIAAWAEAYDARVRLADEGDQAVGSDEDGEFDGTNLVDEDEAFDDVEDARRALDSAEADLAQEHAEAEPDAGILARCEERADAARSALAEADAELDRVRAVTAARQEVTGAYADARGAAAAAFSVLMREAIGAHTSALIDAALRLAYRDDPRFIHDFDVEEYVFANDKRRTLAEVDAAVRASGALGEEDEDDPDREPPPTVATTIAWGRTCARASVLAELRLAAMRGEEVDAPVKAPTGGAGKAATPKRRKARK